MGLGSPLSWGSRPKPRGILAAFLLALAGCGEDSSTVPDNSMRVDTTAKARTDTSGTCSTNCDASPPSIPVLTDSVSYGDVTTYGGTNNANPSSGGACLYGATGITHYAAIQVSRIPGDLRGQWNGGRICGQCFEVRARTATGWKSTHVRITDKCPDDRCGIDLGGAPATDLMDAQAGRYAGQWRPISCAGLSGVSDGTPTLFVKDGSNAWWSLVQVRNPPSAVTGIRMRPDRLPETWDTLSWASEAENYFKVPPAILSDSNTAYALEIRYRLADPIATKISPKNLAVGGKSVPLP